MLIIKIITLVCCVGIKAELWAQRIHEIGVSLDADLNYRLSYKTGKTKNFFRLQTLFLNGNNIKKGRGQESDFGIGFSLGTESRHSLANNIAFVYGFNLGLNYQVATRTIIGDPSQLTLKTIPNMNIILGMNYRLGKHWVISLELLPYFNVELVAAYSNLKETQKTVDIDYGLRWSSLQLIVAYRFNKIH